MFFCFFLGILGDSCSICSSCFSCLSKFPDLLMTQMTQMSCHHGFGDMKCTQMSEQGTFHGVHSCSFPTWWSSYFFPRLFLDVNSEKWLFPGGRSLRFRRDVAEGGVRKKLGGVDLLGTRGAESAPLMGLGAPWFVCAGSLSRTIIAA